MANWIWTYCRVNKFLLTIILFNHLIYLYVSLNFTDFSFFKEYPRVVLTEFFSMDWRHPTTAPSWRQYFRRLIDCVMIVNRSLEGPGRQRYGAEPANAIVPRFAASSISIDVDRQVAAPTEVWLCPLGFP